MELVTIVDYKSFLALDSRGKDGKPGHRGARYVPGMISLLSQAIV
jgi:hypothetical protein